MTNTQTPSAKTHSWLTSFLWLLLAAGCFNISYASIHHLWAGMFIVGYVIGLVQLTKQPTVRRAFYFGLATAYLSYAPQSLFMWKIFGPFAIVLWLVLSFWVKGARRERLSGDAAGNGAMLKPNGSCRWFGPAWNISAVSFIT